MVESQPCVMSIGDLIEPGNFTEPVDICGCDTKLLVDQLRTMLLIRYAEEQIGACVT